VDKWPDYKVSDGTDQHGRHSPALLPGYVNVDELQFEQLLAMVAKLAGEVNFYSLQNRVDGNWSDLFSADEAVIMAMIISFNLKKTEGEFLHSFSGPLDGAAMQAWQLAKTIDFWLTKLDRNSQPTALALGQSLRDLVLEKLAPRLRALSQLLLQLELLQQQELNQLDRAWGIGRDHATQESLPTQDNDIGVLIKSSFYAFYNAIAYLKSLTPIYLQESLGSEQHDPAMALVMVFLKLYERAQQSVNRFTIRHRDFYYRRALHANPRIAMPESVYLVLESQTNADSWVEKGTCFSAGKDDQLKDILFAADTGLRLSDAKVKTIYTIAAQRDPLVAPERELGYVTRIRVNRPLYQDKLSSIAWPLLGECVGDESSATSEDIALGFSLASPVLLLREGRRKIELSIQLRPVNNTTASTSVTMLKRKVLDEGESFSHWFAPIFSRYLLSEASWLNEEQKAVIIEVAQQALDKEGAAEISDLLNQDRQVLFYKLMKQPFRLKVTGESGWLVVDDYAVGPYSGDRGGFGLRLSMMLTQDMESVVSYSEKLHHAGLDTDQPVLQCCINPQSNFCAYSLFTELVIESIDLDVAVQGVKDILLYNNQGQLDPSKPFMPFGPLPGDNSYLVFGNYELAGKRLTELQLNLEWGELPSTFGGFVNYYQGYANPMANEQFTATFSALSDGYWQPKQPDPNKTVGLFNSDEETGQPLASRSLAVNILEHAKPIYTSVKRSDYRYELASRNGFYRLNLSGPQGRFGHSEYPMLLSSILSQNAKRKKPLPQPNPPYTPLLNGIGLDYSAHERILVAETKQIANATQSAKLFHHHPFGVEQVFPFRRERVARLFPSYNDEGALYIGLQGSQVVGQLSLFFHITDRNSHVFTGEIAMCHWSYLTGDGWQRIPATNVLADSTQGFLTSGVVTLDIPETVSDSNPIMPQGSIWLRCSVKKGAALVGHCYAISCNGLQLTRCDNRHAQAPVAQGAKWQPMTRIPGLSQVRQVTSTFGGHAAESDDHFTTRLAERLRHKRRASNSWDYERLVLAKFPNVAKVKCLPNLSSQGPSKPGQVMVVVVPHVNGEQVAPTSRARLSPVELNRIGDFLQRHSSPFVQIEVRNPVYEQIQIRCSVKFNNEAGGAALAKQLDIDVSEYLSPWKARGYRSRFGWSIRQKDVESFIRELDYVEYVTNFSMLHITADNQQNYRLGDTARHQGRGDGIIEPRLPWSLAIPANHHAIETITVAHTIQAEITGIDELEIGNTFIISGTSDHGEEE